MRVFNEQLVTNVVLDANVNSTFVPLKNIIVYSILAVITGTPTGTFKLQASDDPETNDTMVLVAPTNWADIPNTSTAVSAAGNTLWNLGDIGYNYVRVVYTDGSGGASTAILNMRFNGKGY